MVHVYFCFYNFARLSAPDPRSGAARSSRLLQMVYVRCVLRLMDTGTYTIHWPGHAHILIQFHSISAYLTHVTLRRGLIFQENTILPLWKGEYFPLGSLRVHNALWTRASVTLGGQQCQPMRGRHCQAPTNQSLVFPGPGSATRVLRFYPRADLSSHSALTAKRG